MSENKKYKSDIEIAREAKLQNILEIAKKKLNIGIHIDTGINRLGIPIEELSKFKNNKNITIVLVLSHLASADKKNNPYITSTSINNL